MGEIPRNTLLIFILVLLSAAWAISGINLAALPLLLILPGYAISSALYPERDDLDLIERMILSIGLSISVLPAFALGLDNFGLKLFGSVSPLLVVLLSSTAIFALTAILRRSNIIHDLKLQGSNPSAPQMLAAIFLLLSILAVSTIQSAQPLEFSILDKNDSFNYCNILSDDETGLVKVIVCNSENDAAYSLVVDCNGHILDREILNLRGRERWEREVKYMAPPGDSRLNFTLYSGSDAIRRLHLLLKHVAR